MSIHPEDAEEANAHAEVPLQSSLDSETNNESDVTHLEVHHPDEEALTALEPNQDEDNSLNPDANIEEALLFALKEIKKT